MSTNIFQDLRKAAEAAAMEFAKGQLLELDWTSVRLVKLPGQWRGLWVFSAVNVGGDLKDVSVMMEPGAPGLPDYVRLMAPGILHLVSLKSFKRRTEALLASRPKSQGQTVSDAAYENAKRDGLGNLVHGPWRGMTGMAAPSPAPFPHQAE